jgi:ABC-type transport system involved in multi-copper enzyme maturation permease subunit
MSSQATARLSNEAAWTKALLWKEIRQVLPLMLTVLGMGFGTLLLILIAAAFSTEKLNHGTGFWFLFLSMPMMYATGVGILLVGTEKESRSMQWMRSLPVSAKHIAWNKLVVALVTLALVWLIALSSWAIFASALGAPLSTSDRLMTDYLMVSVFLCLAGFAFAWRFESQIVSLVMLIPAALAIWLLSYGISAWLKHSFLSSDSHRSTDSWVYFVGLTIGSIVALVYGWRVSQRELSALAAPGTSSGIGAWFAAIFGIGSSKDARSEARFAEAWSLWPSVTPLGGMLWQMILQNRLWWSLIGLAALPFLAIGVSYDIKGNVEPIDGDWLGWVALPMGLLSGLLGVLAFQSDGIGQRVRFYADRGVSPSVLWLTRHWIPLTIVLAFAIARYLSLRLVPRMDSQWILLDTAALLVGCLATYIVGQWVSQFIKSPILSAIVLPVVLVTSLVYCIFSVVAMEAPWWMLVASFVITAISTWWMMRPWMERRIDWKYYLQHGLFVLAALFVPLIPGLWKIWNLPNMPAETRTKLEQLARSNSGARHLTPNIGTGYLTSIDGLGKESVQAVFDRNEQNRNYQQNQVIKQAANPDYWLANQDPLELLKTYLAELASLQNILMQAQDDSGIETKETLSKYRDAMADIPKLVAGLRATKRLRFCDLAELIELSALGHCKHSKARLWMSDSAYESVARFLGDDQARDEARRVALAAAWWEPKRNFNPKRDVYYGLDGYPLGYEVSNQPNQGSIPGSLRMLRGRDLVIADLWKLLEFPAGSQQAVAYRDKIGSSNSYAQQIAADGQFIVMPEYNILAPAETWRGGWEVMAKKLATEVKGQ